MPITRFGQWQAAIGILEKWTLSSPNAVDAAVRDEAFYFQRKVVEQFRTQGDGKWNPLHPITLAMRRGASEIGRPGSKGTNALIGTGGLRKSVQTHRQGFANYFVGVHRTAGKSGSGKAPEYTNVAEIHETGPKIIPVTDKMRAYFRWLFWKGVIPYPFPRPGKRYLVIPRRSFVGSAMKAFKPKHKERVIKRYRRHLAGLGSMRIK